MDARKAMANVKHTPRAPWWLISEVAPSIGGIRFSLCSSVFLFFAHKIWLISVLMYFWRPRRGMLALTQFRYLLSIESMIYSPDKGEPKINSLSCG